MPDVYMTSRWTQEGAWGLWHGPVLDAQRRPIPERAPLRVSDEHLEYWGRVFVDNNLYAQGIRFDYFIVAPEEFIEALARRRRDHYAADDAFEPPLPAQARVARQVALQTPLGQLADTLETVPGAVMRDGTLIEPLHHTRFPRKHDRRAL